VLLAALLISPLALRAQDSPPAAADATQPETEKRVPTTQEVKAAEAAAARKPQTVADFALNEFLELNRRGDAEARKLMSGYLDPRELDKGAQADLATLAVQLAEFLDKKKLVSPAVLEAIKLAPEATEHCLYYAARFNVTVPTSQPTSKPATGEGGESTEPTQVCHVRFVKQEDGLWRFGPQTTAKIRLLTLAQTEAADPAKVVTPEKTTKPPTATESGGEPSAAPQPSPVPKYFRSPQATMGSFLQAFDPKAQDRILPAECLNLSKRALSPQDAWSRSLALGVKCVLDRTLFIKVRTFPDNPDSSSPHPVVTVKNDLGEEVGFIRLEKTQDGRWLFDNATLDDLPDMVRAVWDSSPKVPNALEISLFETPELYVLGLVPEWALASWWILQIWQWIGLFLVIVAGVIADRIARAVLRALSRFTFDRLSKHTTTELKETSFRPIGIVLMGFLWSTLFPYLWLPAWLGTMLTTMTWFVIILAGIWATFRIIDILTSILSVIIDRRSSTFDDLLVPFVRKVLKILVTIVGVVYFFGRLYPEDVNKLLGGLGLGGLAFALAAQDTIKNVFGSITVMLDRPFEIGDWIKLEGVEGTVESVGFRSTRVRTFANSLISVPNGKLIEAVVDNFGRRQYRRLSCKLNVTYSTTPEQLESFCEGIRELIRRHPYTRKDMYHVYFNEFGAHSLDILVYMFFEAPDWATELRERHRLLTDILRLARCIGVDFAFPTQTLHLHNADEASPVDPNIPQRAANLAADIIGRSEAAAIAKITVPPPESIQPVAIPTDPQPVDEDYIKQRLGIVDELEPEKKKKGS